MDMSMMTFDPMMGLGSSMDIGMGIGMGTAIDTGMGIGVPLFW